MGRVSRSWKVLLPLGLLVIVATVAISTALGASKAKELRVAIMSDCKGEFAFGYDLNIGGAQAAFAQFAGGKVNDPKKPSAGMTGIKIGNTNVKLIYGCGDATAPTMAKETRRVMEQFKADVMIGPISGDEAISVANYAKKRQTKTFIIGAGSQDPTLQIAPKNLFRYHADGAQWNAGIGEIAYKKLGWRKAAIIMDDYSFGWTSAAGTIADFCAIGGKITKRVFPPLGTTDYASFIQQLPPPGSVDGIFWAVGGTGTSPALTAYEQTYGALDPKKHIGNLFFGFLGADKVIAPKLVGAYVSGASTGPGLKTVQAKRYEAIVKKWYPGLNPADLFVSIYYNSAKALIQGLKASGGVAGASLQAKMPRSLSTGYEVSDKGLQKLDANRQAITDQYQLQLVKNADGSVGPAVVAYVPNVDQSFGGLFKKSSPAPGRTQPPCVKQKLPWQNKLRVVKDGVITNEVIK